MREQAESMRDEGLELLAIPIFGWMVGTGLAVAGAAELDQGSDAVDIAREEVDSSEYQVSKYSSKVSEFQSLIPNAQCKVPEADHKLQQTQADLLALSERRGLLAEVQGKMRRAVNQLGLLCGVGWSRCSL